MEDVVTENRFYVRTGTYEGPLEIILDLIEKRKLLVNELSLAQITDDYITYIRSQATFPMEDAADFIGVAATLLLIKSKSLLPDLALSVEEEDDVEDLKRRLSAYERTREAARELSQIFGRSVLISAGERKPEPMFAPSRDLTLDSIQRALLEALAALEKEEKLPEARVRPTFTIEEIMDSLTKRVQSALTLSFKEFTGNAKEKVEVIVSFLALLELVKQGAVEAAQQSVFGEINISNTTATTPHYG
jgi:segregation and condensation protein A